MFGDWKSREVPRERFVEPPSSTRRVIVVDKPDSVQTEIRVGHLGIPRNHPDYMALNLAIRILGGEGSNRLHQVLRTERGLTYGAQADMDTLQGERRLRGGDQHALRRHRRSAAAHRRRVLAAAARTGVGGRARRRAKAYMTGSFPLTIETPDSIALQVLNVMFYGLPLEQLQTFRERVNAVTVDDIERVARFYLKPDAVSVVLVGNASAFVPQLRGVGFGRFETIRARGPRSADARTSRRRQGRRGGQGGAPGRRRRRSGRCPAASLRLSIWRACQQAQPGRRRRRREGDGAARPGDRGEGRPGDAARHQEHQGGDGRDDDLAGRPGGTHRGRDDHLPPVSRSRARRNEGAAGTAVQVYDGERGWVRDPGGVHDVPEAALRDMAASLKRDTVAALLAAERGELRARLLPDVKDADGAHSSRAGAVEPRARTARALRRSANRPHRQAGLRRARARPAADRGAVLRLSSGRRRQRRVRAPKCAPAASRSSSAG